MSVKVNVLPASPPDPSLKTKIDDIEFGRSDEEKDWHIHGAIRLDI